MTWRQQGGLGRVKGGGGRVASVDVGADDVAGRGVAGEAEQLPRHQHRHALPPPPPPPRPNPPAAAGGDGVQSRGRQPHQTGAHQAFGGAPAAADAAAAIQGAGEGGGRGGGERPVPAFIRQRGSGPCAAGRQRRRRRAGPPGRAVPARSTTGTVPLLSSRSCSSGSGKTEDSPVGV